MNYLMLLLLLVSCSTTKTTNLKTYEEKSFYAQGFELGSKLSDLELTSQNLDEVSKGFRDAINQVSSKVDLEVYEQNVKYAYQSKVPNEDLKTYYAMGYLTGQDYKGPSVSEKDLKVLQNGFISSARGESLSKELVAYLPRVQKLDALSQYKKVGERYISEYLKNNSKAKVTTSGLVYEVIEEGTGRSPSAINVVEVHYHGTFTNGEVFDSSVVRGKTASFPLNQVIRGWTEGLQLMKEGAKYRFIIPSDLAYGDFGAGDSIPGGSTLVFEVELLRVIK